ncbi:hypothetical protein Pmar_PMAR005321 [Perkinsus marinus ATCC 50983]|uniref:Vesicle transport v-SNARE N-terminal domain-containing protein n=1 Tax=Perkinsus marinus (strain ATCC 50983 / TXsc) TaxID=423536 RepID=C5KB84_PERM5|nr:hypothetical protein Pmar_PMAR005321 [Perkinsus marinus ATCC 50983]EER18410.1 hypothetical protein Pmar_PMAR005321 [Perkinsus marinus ATCC 50983]|eukprot:XP_002786614.1 hypothetical protein Pmar_PMAR005321 [Perkinsus marinus ATCC 50983]
MASSSIFDSYASECRRQVAEATSLEEVERMVARLEQLARSGPQAERSRRMAVVGELRALVRQAKGGVESTQRLVALGEASSSALNQAILNTVDTERTALGITSELARQRQTLSRAKANADMLEDDLSVARGSVQRMESNATQCCVM